MGKIIILGSEKGGVAKTTSTYNLAYCLVKEGKRVLAVDFDSQANLSTCFGIEDTGAMPVTIGHLLMNRIEDEKLPDALEYIMSRNGVDFIPSSVMLSVVDAKLRLEMGAERMLAGILEPLKGQYDYILVDTLCGYPHKVSNAELNIMQSNYLQSLIKPMIFFLFTQHNIPYRIPLTNHRQGVPIWSNTR